MKNHLVLFSGGDTVALPEWLYKNQEILSNLGVYSTLRQPALDFISDDALNNESIEDIRPDLGPIFGFIKVVLRHFLTLIKQVGTIPDITINSDEALSVLERLNAILDGLQIFFWYSDEIPCDVQTKHTHTPEYLNRLLSLLPNPIQKRITTSLPSVTPQAINTQIYSRCEK